MAFKLLIVEDDRTVRENICDLLDAENYLWTATSNGIEALNILSSHKPDLIISDIMMPYMSGYEFFNRVHESKSTSRIPFIFLTAKSDHDSIRSGMTIGADDYITKPYAANDLLSAIKTRLKKSKSFNDLLDELKLNISKYVPHEMRTPLVSILGYSDLILEEENSITPEELKEMIIQIKRSGNRLSERIEKFLLYTELSTNLQNLDSEFNIKMSSEINEIIFEKLLNNNREYFNRRDDITFSFEEEKLSIPELYLNFILKELIQNACNFSEVGTPITVFGYSGNNFYQIIISDFGRGMVEDDLNLISAFKQFERETYQQTGNGLGLSIISKIVENVNGKIDIKSKKNIGTKITISIRTIPSNEFIGKR